MTGSRVPYAESLYKERLERMISAMFALQAVLGQCDALICAFHGTRRDRHFTLTRIVKLTGSNLKKWLLIGANKVRCSPRCMWSAHISRADAEDYSYSRSLWIFQAIHAQSIWAQLITT